MEILGNSQNLPFELMFELKRHFPAWVLLYGEKHFPTTMKCDFYRILSYSFFCFNHFRVYLTLTEKCLYPELFWSVFSRILTEYEVIRIISPYSVRMLENTDKNKSEYGHILRSFNSIKFRADLISQSPKILNFVV